MQPFRVVYHEISHLSPVSSWYTHSPTGLCVYQENTSDKWDTSWYTMRGYCITILYNDIENTVANTISVTYTRHMMGRLDLIPRIYNGFPVF